MVPIFEFSELFYPVTHSFDIKIPVFHQFLAQGTDIDWGRGPEIIAIFGFLALFYPYCTTFKTETGNSDFDVCVVTAMPHDIIQQNNCDFWIFHTFLPHDVARETNCDFDFSYFFIPTTLLLKVKQACEILTFMPS